MHPRHTLGLLLEYTDDKLPGDQRLGAPEPGGQGLLPVTAVAWVTAVVDDLDAAVECLRYTLSAEVLIQPMLGIDPGERAVEVRIGDMTVRLVVPSSDSSVYAGSAGAGTGRYHSMALAVDHLSRLDEALAAAGIGILARDNGTVWTDPGDTLGLPLQFVDAALLESA